MATVKHALLAVALTGLALAGAAPAAAQALPSQVQALYPPDTGEVVFADLRAMRGSRHYAQIKAQVLPAHFRQLETFGTLLGIDFERSVHQLSWAFVGPDGSASFGGVAEGDFSLAAIETQAKRQKLAVERINGHLAVVLGKSQEGTEFLFAFPDRTLALFGYRRVVEGMLERRAQGGLSLLENAALRGVVEEVNGKAAVWMALDNPYTVLAIRQMLPEAARLPGFDTLVGRMQSTSMRIELRDGLRGMAAVRCQSSADAVLLSTIVQAALTYHAYQLNEKNPELARVIREASVDRTDDRFQLSLNVPDRDLLTLLQKNSLTLTF
jgi:hypothetical protein